MDGSRRRHAARLRALPWWIAAGVGVLAIAVGSSVALRPFASLDALVVAAAACLVVVGAADLAALPDVPAPRLTAAAGAAAIALGVAVLAWPGIALGTLAVLVGLGLAVGGAARIAAALGARRTGRAADLVGGLARVVLGALALAWPDVTVLVVAVLVGPAAVVAGAGLLVGALLRRDADSGRARRPHPWLRLVGALAGLAVALVLLAVSAAIHRGSSRPDAFYAAPADVPARPGVLLRSAPFMRRVPDGARAFRILYTTSLDDSTPALASALVVVPSRAAGPVPVIAWAHGTTGYARKCAPSLLPEPFASGVMPALDDVVARGWAVVATDYTGLGTPGSHPYLIGEPEARSVIDAVRAARHLPGVALAGTTVVWGHSQGGGAALWAGQVAPAYAPDVPLAGVAALAPASDLAPIFTALREAPVGRILGAYIVEAYAARYPDVRAADYVRPAARTVERRTAGRCLSGAEALVSVAQAVNPEPVLSRSPADGPLGARLRENTPEGRVAAPLLLAQGTADALVLPDIQSRYVARRCAAGQVIDYRTYRGLDHVGLVVSPGSPLVPDLLAWTADRVAGRPAATACSTMAR